MQLLPLAKPEGGDKHLESLIRSWEHVLADVWREPETQVKEFPLDNDLSKCSIMREDISHYACCEPSHADHTHEWLLKRARVDINRKRQLAHGEAKGQSFGVACHRRPAVEAKKGSSRRQRSDKRDLHQASILRFCRWAF